MPDHKPLELRPPSDLLLERRELRDCQAQNLVGRQSELAEHVEHQHLKVGRDTRLRKAQ